MSEDEANGDDAAAEAELDEESVDLEAIDERLTALAADLEEFDADLEAAETEDDLDVVEADLESFREDLEAVEISDPPESDEDEEDEEPAPEEKLQDTYDEIESDLSDLESDLEDQRGPYGEDVVSEINSASGTITSTRWTEEGNAELIEAVDDFLDELAQPFARRRRGPSVIDQSLRINWSRTARWYALQAESSCAAVANTG